MKKLRTPIPSKISSDILFSSDRTCCVCNERGKYVQIHHIDENPSNHALGNLCVLCLECHNDTQVTGGFGRKLTNDVVVKYRDDWLQRVKQRREESDKIAISKTSSISVSVKEFKNVEKIEYSEEQSDLILEFVESLPDLRYELLDKAQPEWDTGVTARVVNANYEYIDSLQGILVRMASFYPKGTFGDNTQDFFSEQISLRFYWHRSYAEPYGPGTGGTIVNITIGSSVIEDVEKMVEDMAMALVGYDDRFDWRRWPSKWKGRK